METVYGIIMIFIIIACVMLVLVVLSQNPKGGGLSSTFGGSGTQMFGVQKTNDFMDKATWTLGGIIVVLSIFASVMIAKPTAYNSGSRAPQKTSQPANTQQPATPEANGK